jgi:carbonic anhydrase
LTTEVRIEDPADPARGALSPEAALEALLAGNRRFVSGEGNWREHDLAALKERAAMMQEPFACVLSCADSRVPVELVFDQSIGHIFVTRVAGNIVTPEILGSLEFGALVLGAKVILVMGHVRCGAVKAALDGAPVPGMIGSLFPYLQPAVDQAGQDCEAAIRINAKLQAAILMESSPVLAGLMRQGKLKVAAAVYDIATGEVALV